MSWKPTRDSAALLTECQKLLKEHSGTITLRQLFYLLVNSGHVEYTEPSYRKVKNLMINARKHGRVPPTTFSYAKPISDESVFGTPEKYLAECAANYMIPRTYNQPNHVEIWVEREPHKVFISSLLSEYGVPVYVTGGYSSFSFVFDAAKRIEASVERHGSPRVLYFSDLSPASINMFESQVSEISSHLDLTLEEVDAIMLRVGVEPEHVIKFDLPVLEELQPTQKTALFELKYSDLLQTFGIPRVPIIEIESMNPTDLAEVVSNVLFSLTDQSVLEDVALLEDKNKKVLNETVKVKNDR